MSLAFPGTRASIAGVSPEEDLPPHLLSPKVHWERASGYFALEMYEEAKREIRALPAEEPWGKQARILTLGIYQEKEEWMEMREVANGLRREFPEEEDWWISDAYATRRCESIEAARELLIEGLARHLDSAMIRYNLACYACVLDSPGECMDFLKEAVERDEKYKLLAVEDEDLSEVREALLKMGWGKAEV